MLSRHCFEIISKMRGWMLSQQQLDWTFNKNADFAAAEAEAASFLVNKTYCVWKPPSTAAIIGPDIPDDLLFDNSGFIFQSTLAASFDTILWSSPWLLSCLPGLHGILFTLFTVTGGLLDSLGCTFSDAIMLGVFFCCDRLWHGPVVLFLLPTGKFSRCFSLQLQLHETR